MREISDFQKQQEGWETVMRLETASSQKHLPPSACWPSLLLPASFFESCPAACHTLPQGTDINRDYSASVSTHGKSKSSELYLDAGGVLHGENYWQKHTQKAVKPRGNAQNVRGKIQNPRNTKILQSAKFCTKTKKNGTVNVASKNAVPIKIGENVIKKQ